MTAEPGAPVCWYADPHHRPAIGWCPQSCNGPPTHSELAGNGERLLYCEAHAYWRRKTIRLPLVRRMRPDDRPARTDPAPAPTTTAPDDPPLQPAASGSGRDSTLKR
jgi:hypothetical protein